jgi:hypothetical protein
MRIRSIVAAVALIGLAVSLVRGDGLAAGLVVAAYVVSMFLRDAVRRRTRESNWNAVRYNVGAVNPHYVVEPGDPE